MIGTRFDKDADGKLVKRMGEVVDGNIKISVEHGDYIETFFW
jgi:hypothetical protein